MALSEEQVNGYKCACEAHRELESFDSSLEKRTIKVIDKVTTKAETGTGFSSQHEIHMEVSKHLLEVSQDVANFILESEDDVWENIPLRSLVKAYFENTKKTLKIFDNIIEYVEKAELGQHVILEAVAQFDKESGEKDVGGKKKKYGKTLKELKKFKAMGDPFASRELTTQFKLIKEQQESLVKDVSEAKKELDNEVEKAAEEKAKKHKWSGAKKELDKEEETAAEAKKQKWSFWSNVILGAAACIAFVTSVGLIASGVGAPVDIALAGVLLVGIVPGWKDVQIFLKNRIDALKRQQEALGKLSDKLSSVEIGAETNEEALESVSELVDGVEKKISSILTYVDDAIDNEGDEVDTKRAMHSIRDKVKKITEKLKELGESVDSHSKLIRQARDFTFWKRSMVLENIISVKHLNSRPILSHGLHLITSVFLSVSVAK